MMAWLVPIMLAAAWEAASASRGAPKPAFRAIDPRHELMWARWVLTPAAGGKVESGMTTLLFERRPEG